MNWFSDFRVALRLALRVRFLAVSLWLVVALGVVVWMASQFSARQPTTVGLDVGLSVIRLALPVVAVLLLQELVSQEFARKLFLTSITYPRPRYHFLLGRFVAVYALVLVLLVVLAAVLAALILLIGHGYTQGTPVALDFRYLFTIVFIAVDLGVITALATLLAVTAVTPSFVLIGTLGFMLVARSFSPIVALLARDSSLVEDAQTYQMSLNLLRYFLPDLAALDVRMITLYGKISFLPPDWVARVSAAVAYSGALIAMAVWVLGRKRFT